MRGWGVRELIQDHPDYEKNNYPLERYLKWLDKMDKIAITNTKNGKLQFEILNEKNEIILKHQTNCRVRRNYVLIPTITECSCMAVFWGYNKSKTTLWLTEKKNLIFGNDHSGMAFIVLFPLGSHRFKRNEVFYRIQ